MPKSAPPWAVWLCKNVLSSQKKKVGKDLGKITAEEGTLAYAQVRLSTKRTNYVQIWCWSPEPELNLAFTTVTAVLKKMIGTS
jgi:hypothetical protein